MKLVNAILNFLSDIGHASYAAHLARNGKWSEAQATYKR